MKSYGKRQKEEPSKDGPTFSQYVQLVEKECQFCYQPGRIAYPLVNGLKLNWHKGTRGTNSCAFIFSRFANFVNIIISTLIPIGIVLEIVL
ncbi:hypothetical protein SE18_19550 [Herpetosiphon geysericola]|uniref:Uncharacterized protein n=1 Tax=Herpetosiphon geysericola TaxID=70996 RepID=A0A0P6XIJ0_9CHLR|nr:hypothetical protein SE18_19550 [Herpetosiphon geysericola]